jgi:hypothetical protein
MEMNDKIDELMIQAGARFEFLHGVHYDDFQYRKFAELIVKECVRYFNEDYQRNFDSLWREDLSKGIKQHFGVKE